MRATSTPSSAFRTLKVLEELLKTPVEGLSNKDLADRTGYHATNVSRALSVLMLAGWATQLENGRYTCTTKPHALNRYFSTELDAMRERATALETRVTAQAFQLSHR